MFSPLSLSLPLPPPSLTVCVCLFYLFFLSLSLPFSYLSFSLSLLWPFLSLLICLSLSLFLFLSLPPSLSLSHSLSLFISLPLVCESLVDEFDPLLQQPVATVGSTSASNSNVTFHIGGSFPHQNSLRIPSHHRLPTNDPFAPTNPLLSSLKSHGNTLRCLSETNIASLEKESSLRHTQVPLHTAHSDEDLLSETPKRNDHAIESKLAVRNSSPVSSIPSVVVPDSPMEEDTPETSLIKPTPLPRSSSPVSWLTPRKSPQPGQRRSLPRERPQGAVFAGSDDSYHMDNPFQDQEDSDTTSPRRSWLDEVESSIELKDVDTDEEEKLVGARKKSNTDAPVLEKVGDHGRPGFGESGRSRIQPPAQQHYHSKLDSSCRYRPKTLSGCAQEYLVVKPTRS